MNNKTMRSLIVQESERRVFTSRLLRRSSQPACCRLQNKSNARLISSSSSSQEQQPTTCKNNKETVIRDETRALSQTSSSPPPPLLPPLNGLESQIHASNNKNFSWKTKSYQILQEKDNTTPNHIVLECLQWWTRQRPIHSSSTSMTWKLLDVLLLMTKQDQQSPPPFPPSRAIWNSVLDHWRLAIQNKVSVPFTVKQVWEKTQTWERLQVETISATDSDEEIQKTYSILLKALSASESSHDNHHHHHHPRQIPLLVNTILQSMPVQASTVTMNAALTVWAKSRSPNAYKEAKRLLQQSTNYSIPNEISYANVLETLLYCPNDVDNIIVEAESLLQEMHDKDIAVNSVCYLQFLRLLIQTNQLERASSLLDELVHKYQVALQTADSNLAEVVVPTRHLFSAVMSGFARRGDYHQVAQLLERLQNLYDTCPNENDKALLLPTATTLNSVLEAYVQKRTLDSTKQAAALLERLEEWGFKQNVTSACLPDTTSYNTVLDAWAEVARFYPHAVKEAEALLETMLQHSHVEPDAYTYTTVMKAWSRSDQMGAAERCEGFLNGMWEAYEREGRWSVKPNDVTYATAMYAWSRVAKKVSAAPYRAEALFRDMKQRYKDGDASLAPTEGIYVSLITTWNRSITPQTKQQALARCQFYFDQMRADYMAGNESMRPTAKMYNALLEGMKQAGDGKGADRIFQLMMNEYRVHNNILARPNSYTFHSVMTAWARSRSASAPLRAEAILKDMNDLYEQKGWDCKPTTIGFSAVLNCWAKSGREEAPERSEAILRHMERLHQAGQEDLKPSMYTYATVLDAWAHSAKIQAPERALALFDELQARYAAGDEGCRPNGAAYLALLSTWGRSQHPDGALKALGILNEMEERHAANPRNERPECFHYSAVINAFAQRGDVENAKALLDRIIKSPTIQPHGACYNGYIKAIIRSGKSDTGSTAEMVLRQMQASESPAQPDVITYTSCIAAWGEMYASSLEDDAVERAQSLLKECISQSSRKSVTPNLSTFLTFLRLLAKSDVLDKSERAQWTLEQLTRVGLRPSHAILSEIERCKAPK